MKLPASYKGLWTPLSRYWADYGGWRDLLRSPFFHLSLIVTAGSYTAWLDPKWVELPLSLLPNLLGFSLGAYTLIFSLADERLLAALNAPKAGDKPTNLRIINATFLHFILVQTNAIIFALINRSSFFIDIIALIKTDIINMYSVRRVLTASAGAFGYFLTIYAVVLLIGAALAAYRLAIMSGKAATDAQQLRQQKPMPPASGINPEP